MISNKIKGLHISGKKELIKDTKAINFLSPKFIYIPLNSCNCLVNANDYVLKGQVVAKRIDRFPFDIHSSVSGRVTGIKKMWHPSGKMVESIEIENDFKETKVSNFTQKFELSKDKIVNVMKQIGLVGLGGAGFPTYVKYENQNANILIINCAECEPYLNTDYLIILNECKLFLKGVRYMQIASGAQKVVIAIKKTKKEAITILKENIIDYPECELLLLNDVYPAGYEKYIVQRVIKHDYEGLPINAGVIVNNAQTAYALARSVEENLPLVEKYITISGEGIKKPVVVRVKVGTLLSEVINFLGGYSLDSSNAYFVSGGPMTGNAMVSDDVIITAASSGACVLRKPKNKKMPECMGCGKCATHCPMKLTPTEIKQAYLNNDLNLLLDLQTKKCIQCGLCSYVCPSKIEISDYVNKAKNFIYKNESNK